MKHIQLTIDGAIARIFLNKPKKHNALSANDIGDFVQALSQICNNPTVRVLVLSGHGEKTFCAGAALDEMASGAMSGNTFETLTDTLAAMPIPTVCAINGNVYGGGAEIALCCDFRVGFADMRMFVPAARFGLCYPPNGIRRYVRRLGVDIAKRILLCCEEFNGNGLLSIGYLTSIAERDKVLSESDVLAAQIASMAPLAVQAMKELCDTNATGSVDTQRSDELVNRCNQSNDLQEGLRARSEKRQAQFTGT